MTIAGGRALLFPSPMWGGVRGGGIPNANVQDSPPPGLPHKGGGTALCVCQTTASVGVPRP
jgi:hypothetical protein